MEKIRDHRRNAQNIRYEERARFIIETNNTSTMKHGNITHKKATEMVMERMCPFPPDIHAMPRCKCVLGCHANCPNLNIPAEDLTSSW